MLRASGSAVGRILSSLLLALAALQGCVSQQLQASDPVPTAVSAAPSEDFKVDDGLASYLMGFPRYPGAQPYYLGLGPLAGDQVVWSNQTPDDAEQVTQYYLRQLSTYGYRIDPVGRSNLGGVAAVSRNGVRRYLFIGLANPTVISLQNLPYLDAAIDRKHFVQEFPTYPGAVTAVPQGSKASPEPSLSWSMTSTDAPQRVREYYETQLARRSFVSKVQSVSKAGVVYQVSRYGLSYTLSISNRAPTQIELRES